MFYRTKKYIFATTIFVLAGTPTLSHADEECTFASAQPATFSLSTDLVGAEVRLAYCGGQDYLLAGLRIGKDIISVSGPWNGSDAATCLNNHFEGDPWPGFLGLTQSLQVCYDPADNSWSTSANASAHIAGGRVRLKDAAFDWSTPSPSFSLGELALGPFTLNDVELGTSSETGIVLPASLSGSLSLALPGGGTLQATGDISEDGFGIAFDLAGLPSNFPFPGITIPATKVSLSFREHGWSLTTSFEGDTSLGPLGTIPIDAGELEIWVPEEGDWKIAGCLSSPPTDLSMDLFELSDVEVDVCAASDGNAELSWKGAAILPSLGLGPVATEGSLAHENGIWSGELGFVGALPAGPLGDLNLEGEFSLSGDDVGSATLTGCLQAATSTALLGDLPADIRFKLGNSCRPGPEFDLSFDGTMQIADQDVAASGSLQLGPDSWSTEVELSNLSFGDFILEDAKLAVDSDNNADLHAELQVGVFPLLVTGQVKGSGDFSLDVALRSSVELGNGLVINSVSGSLSYNGGSWSINLNVSGAASIAGNDITVSGDLDLEFDAPSGEWTINSCLAAETLPADLPLTAASAEVCWQDGQATFRVTGTININGSAVVVSGSYALDPNADPEIAELILTLELAASDSTLVLGPGVELEEVKLTVNPVSSGFALVAKLCLGELCMNVSGDIIGGPANLDLHMSVDSWRPFSQFQPFSGELIGHIEIDEDNKVSLSYRVASNQNYTIAPGLVLTSIFAGGQVNSDGEWKLKLGGDSTISFGDDEFDLSLVGSVDNTGKWSLNGDSDLSFQPLEQLLGSDTFIVSNPGFAIEATTGQFAIEMRAELAMVLIPGAPAIQTGLRGGLVSGTSTGLWFVGTLDGLELPGLGDTPWALPALYFAASTAPIDGFDLLDTPEDESDDIRIEQGVTLTTIAELPVALVPDQPSMRLSVHLGQEGLKLSGTLDNLGLDLITQEHNLPTIKKVTFDRLSLDASISSTGTLKMGFRGDTLFTPSNQDQSLLASAKIEVGYLAPLVTISGQMSIAGRWIEPFGIPRIAIQDPAFKLGFAVTTSYPPVPTLNAIGFNGDGFWLKEGSWPQGFENTSVPAPSRVVRAGSTFYFELEPKPSGICLGICLPLPPVIARISLNNLSLSELIDSANALKDGIRDMILAAVPEEVATTLALTIPDGSFSSVDIRPLDLSVHSLEFYLSTHDIEPWPGIRFQSGVHADLDVEIAGHQAELHGQLSMDGLVLEGRVDPITVGNFQLTGNPHSNYADLSRRTYSTVRMTGLDFNKGTIEGWVRSSGNSHGYLFHHNSSGSRQLYAGVTQAEQVCSGPHGTECKSMNRARLFLRNGTKRQELLSEALIESGTWHHLAAVLDDDEIRLLVDGSVVASSPRQFMTTFTGTGYFGYKLNAVDEVRMWNEPLDTEHIADNPYSLSISENENSALLIRYSFDYDRGSIANNSRYYSGNKRHGSYSGDAVATLDEREQKLLLQLNLSISDPAESGIHIRGGASFDPLGGNTPVAFSTELVAGGDEVRGSLYSPAVTLFTIPNFGKFSIDGNGPNTHANDFDDGIYASFDLMDGEFQSSGKLLFEDSSGAESTVASMDVAFRCPAGSTCSSPSSHRLNAMGTIDLQTPQGTPGDLRLTGTASYKSATEELVVNGALNAFGMPLSSSLIRINQSGIHLQSTVSPGAGVGLDLGSQSLLLDYQYQPARICGSGTGTLKLPGTSTHFTSNTHVCFGSSPSLTIDGTVANLRIGGVDIQNASVGYDNGKLSLSGHVSISGVFSGTLSGWYRSPSDFSLTASSNVSLGGFSMSNAALTLTPSGFSAQGSLNLGVAQLDATVWINRWGNFTLSGNTEMNFSGYTLASAHYNLNEDGLTVNGSLDVVGKSWTFGGRVYSDGAFLFEGTETLSIQGFQMSNASVSLARYTSSHSQGGGDPDPGLRIEGNLSMPYGNNVGFDFSVSTSGNFTAIAEQTLTLKGWELTNGRIRLTKSSLMVKGNMAIPGASLSVDTRLYSNGSFDFSANPNLNLGGFGLTNGYIRFRSSNGLYMRGKARLGSSRYQIDGQVSSLSSWQLCTSSSSVSPTNSSILPKLTGRFCLKKYGSGAQLTGDGSASFHGRTFDATFRISTSGGIEYLSVSEAPNPFILLGSSITGTIRFKVENNSLTKFSWTGRLKVLWPWGGIFINIYKTVGLSRFKLCPTDFVPVIPPQFSAACAYMYF